MEQVIIDTPQKIACDKCGRTYLVAAHLIPAEGARVTCRRCGAAFTIHRPKDAARRTDGLELPEPPFRVPSDPDSVPAPVTKSAPPASSRRVWVFPDDPALQHRGVLPFLKVELAQDRVQFLEEDHRRVIYDHLWPPPPESAPDVIVFGDMHVLTEDPLLQRLATGIPVHRVLLSTHYNLGLVQAARVFCGFDRHLTLPLDLAKAREALGTRR